MKSPGNRWRLRFTARSGAGGVQVNTIAMRQGAALAALKCAGALGGPGNEDGIGAAARFQALSAVVSEDPSTVYVADNGVIRRLEVASRAVTTLWHEDLDL